MTLSDAYFMMWENPNFTENRKFSFILKEKCSGEKTQDYSPDEKKIQNALESRLSIQFRWDRSMTELKVTIFEPTKKIWIWRPVELQFEHNRHKSPKKPRNLRVLGFLHNISYLFAEFTLPRLWKSFLES